MSMRPSLRGAMEPALDRVGESPLRTALVCALDRSAGELEAVEQFFEQLSRQPWSEEVFAPVVHSWKLTHLKMLAIYGVSCRLQRLAAAEPEMRQDLLSAAARNAETSYEDLGLDYNAVTHGDLYDEFAASFAPSTPWQLARYATPEAEEFRRWVYRTMIVGDLELALLTNLFSEIFNHGEYTIALDAFSRLADRFGFEGDARRRALTYIEAHVVDETEVGHFLVVAEALDLYHRASRTTLDAARAEAHFREYLARIAAVMRSLSARLVEEQAA